MRKRKDLDGFVNDQLSCWPLACSNFRALKGVQVKRLSVGGLDVEVQYNLARIVSSAAKTDEASLKARKCFLCRDNRSAEQNHIRFEGRKGKKYDILVNPYPIFPDHLVIALSKHQPQSIWRRYVDILDLAKVYPDHIFFYNGPKCGASAPDHHHFQGAGKGRMPLENDVDGLLDAIKGIDPASAGSDSSSADSDGRETGCPLSYVASVQDADLFHYRKFVNGIFVLRSATPKSAAKLFYRLLDCAPVAKGDSEPGFNLFTYYKSGEYRSIVIFRTSHRSHHYFSEGPDHLMMSPGCADMAGVLITPMKEDFDKLDDALLSEMLAEVTVTKETEDMIIRRLTRTQPLVEVGIMSAGEIEFEIFSDGAGARKARYRDGKVEYDGMLYDELYFGAVTLSTMFAEPTFELCGVTIGKGFQWERRENQKFAGALRIIVENDLLTAVNVVGLEDYLVSVISSEMKSSASLEFLKAHAVISRSWVMSRMAARQAGKSNENQQAGVEVRSCAGEPDEVIRWYDHTDHIGYDVCADDHCQRYQGLTRAVGKTVRDAVDQTWGEVLMSCRQNDGAGERSVMEICDARFSKCCGGVTEKFSVCWEDKDYDYLPALLDTPGHEAGKKPFCCTSDAKVLSQVLNDYDLATDDFYRWEVRYGRKELSDIVCRRSGVDVGQVNALVPVERGESGRIWKLGIIGSKMELVIGKELEIRRVLSESHLKSSAFEVEYLDSDGNVVAAGGSGAYDGDRSESGDWSEVVLRGRGWGHGVGLCQIGAAVMASEGYSYRRILEHYYPGAVCGQLSLEAK